ncbi:tyrosine-type recombinase/integrase [Anaerotruncus rubiinfantis]|uniref:tyrosine-type recombinase/integrase n=1 Tax=Anaerotruncus rubiinfantis TaxID=1720200 RepID=UPI0034A39ADE
MPRPKKEQPNHAGGLYEVKITIGKTLDGKLLRKSFYSSISKDDARRQAEEWKIQREVANRTGVGFVDKEQTFESWAKTWLETYKKPKVKPHTYDFTYRINVEKYMIPFFKKACLTDITPAIIQEYFNAHNYLAQSNLKRHRGILHSIFEQAINNDLCYKNPVQDISYKSSKPEVIKQAYTQEQSLKAQNYAQSHDDGLFVYLVLNTGLRRSEALGLIWKDIDFKEKTVSVFRAITPDTVSPKDGELKSKTSRRVIPVSDGFIEYLERIQKPDGFVLGDETTFCTIDAFDWRYKKFMTQMSRELSIPYLSPHELRHSYGSVLYERGVDIYTISKVMGHADISITAKIYVHSTANSLRKGLKL